MEIDPQTVAGRAGLAEILADPLRALAAFDYDGTIAPIVADPTQAVPDPDALESLVGISQIIGQVAIITGRPAAAAVSLAGLDGIPGLEHLVVLGHYGVERWNAATGQVTSAPPPAGLDDVTTRLPSLLESLGVADATIENKGLSVAVHTRRMPDPAGALELLREPLAGLAAQHGLVAEPGRMVIELRSGQMHKGVALRGLVDEFEARSVVYTGDDLGDLAAFDSVDAIRAEGGAGLLVCSGSAEVIELAERADVVVDGPAGVSRFVRSLVTAMTTPR
ncbi:MAG: trehalose-phosphatase [Nocardioidaceae bacterium]